MVNRVSDGIEDGDKSIRFGRGVDEVESWRSDAGTSTDDLAESTPSCS